VVGFGGGEQKYPAPPPQKKKVGSIRSRRERVLECEQAAGCRPHRPHADEASKRTIGEALAASRWAMVTTVRPSMAFWRDEAAAAGGCDRWVQEVRLGGATVFLFLVGACLL